MTRWLSVELVLVRAKVCKRYEKQLRAETRLIYHDIIRSRERGLENAGNRAENFRIRKTKYSTKKLLSHDWRSVDMGD